jgi:hypothetical protein
MDLEEDVMANRLKASYTIPRQGRNPNTLRGRALPPKELLGFPGAYI